MVLKEYDTQQVPATYKINFVLKYEQKCNLKLWHKTHKSKKLTRSITRINLINLTESLKENLRY